MTYTNTRELFIATMSTAEARLLEWLARYSVDLLRISVGLVFLAFGVLKFFPGLSPAQDLAARTVEILTFGLVPEQVAVLMVATLESTIGILLITGRWLRLGLALLSVAMVGILSPLVLLPEELFRGRIYAPTLEGQYVLKDLVLLSAAFVIAARALGARMVLRGWRAS
jgi:putative oxidoreductase